MEKEPKPFSEEKAKEMMEAEGLEERSQIEQDAFEAGQRHHQEQEEELEEAKEVAGVTTHKEVIQRFAQRELESDDFKKTISNTKREHKNETERRHLLYEYIRQHFKVCDKIKIKFPPIEVIKANKDAQLYREDPREDWNPQLTRHNMYPGGEGIFYIAEEPIYTEFIFISMVPPEQLREIGNDGAWENSLALYYNEIESVEKVEN